MATTEEQLVLLNAQVSTLTTDVNALLTAVNFKKSELDAAYQAIINAPDTPVFTVNGRIGDVVIGLTDVTTALGFTPYNSNNPSNFITALTAPVRSVAGKTGLVTITAADVGGLAQVAKSGSWNDIIDRPVTFPTNLANGTTPGAVSAGANISIVNGVISSSASSGGTTTQIIDPRILVSRTTVGITPLALTTDSSSPVAGNQISLPDNSSMVVEGLVVARREGGLSSGAWRVKALIKRGAGASTIEMIDSSVDTISNAAGWLLRPTLDTVDGNFRVTATGGTGINVKWAGAFTKNIVTY